MIDFISIFTQYNVEFRTDVNDGWINVCCPHCDDSSFHGGINIYGEYYHCFRCGGNSLEYTLKKLLKIDYRTLDGLLNQYSNSMQLFYQRNKKQAKGKVIELPGGPLEKVHKKYLFNRGFDPDYLERKYKLQGTGLFGEWSYRIIIPIIYNGKVVSFQGRSLLSKTMCKEQGVLRYKTLDVESSIINPKTILYNLDNCKGEKVIVVEGPFDVMRLGDNVCCTLGTTMESAQRRLLADRFKKVLFLFDPEEQAQQRALQQGEALMSLGTDVQIIDSGFTNDPGSFTKDQIKKVKEIAKI